MKQARDPAAFDCAGAMDRLFDFLDGELDAESESQLRTHLEKCAPCFERAGFERRFLEAVQAARESEKCPEKVRARVLNALRRDGWTEPTAS